MSTKKVKALVVIIIIGIVLKVVIPVVFAAELAQKEIARQVEIELDEKVSPLSIQIVDQAIAVLSQGWSEMSQAEREAFLILYDPSNTGDIDKTFIAMVVENFQKIRATLNNGIPVTFETDSGQCIDMRLYYIDFVTLHVCPYFMEEENEVRKARTLVHEMAHQALLVTDRAYYRPTSNQYAELTPRGSWMTQLPVVGRVIAEVFKGDTLNHPDAYAHFALAVSGMEGSEDYYQHDTVEATFTVDEHESVDLSDNQVGDSWSWKAIN